MRKWMDSLLEENSSFKMLGLNFFSKLDRSSYIISIVKTASRKIGALIRSMKFLSAEVALYLYKSTIQPWMERCCHVWAGTGVEHSKNFLKTEGGVGGLTGSQFWQGSSEKEKVTFFSRTCSIFIKNKLKSEIFNDKKLYKQKCFSLP